MQRHFIHTAAVNHRRTLITQYPQSFGNGQYQLRAVDANQRQWRVSRVDQRPQHIEQGAGFKLLANRHRMTETRMVFRCEQEADAQVVQRLTRFIGVHIQIDTECRQQIGRTGFTGDAAVAMFGHLQSTGRRHKGAGGGDIDAVAAITAGADNIGKQIVRARERRGIFQQRGSGASDFIRMFATHFHTDQRRRQLFWLQFATNHGREKLVAFLLGHGLRLVQFFQNRLQRIGRLQFLLRPGQRLFQQQRTLRSKNGLRVELKTTDAIRVVTYRHHHAVKMGVNRQPRRHVAAHQRVITSNRQRVHQTGKHRLSVMFNARRFAVENLARLTDVATVGFNNRLVSEADADNGQLATQTGQQLRHTTGFAGDAWSRGKHQHRVFHRRKTVD